MTGHNLSPTHNTTDCQDAVVTQLTVCRPANLPDNPTSSSDRKTVSRSVSQSAESTVIMPVRPIGESAGHLFISHPVNQTTHQHTMKSISGRRQVSHRTKQAAPLS